MAKAGHRTVSRKKWADGTMALYMKEKLKIFADYYKVLYSSSEPPREDFGGKVNIPRLSEDDQKRLEEPIQFAEIITVINSLKPNKSPGNDGLMGGFYKKKIQKQLGKILPKLF